jgi:hypothetical protein
MDQFSTQFTSSNDGLYRSLPYIRRALKLGNISVLGFVIVGIAAFLLVGASRFLLRAAWPGYPEWLPLILGLAGGLGVLVLVMLYSQKQAVKRFDILVPPLLTRLAVDDSGITISDEVSHAHVGWQRVRGAVATPDGTAILIGYSGILIPRSAFQTAEEQQEVIALINSRATPV